MNKISKFSFLNSVKYRINYFRQLSTQAQKQEIIEKEEKLNVPVRGIQKRPNRLPFMKNVFLANFDTELLAFPEVLDKTELKFVEDLTANINAVFSEVSEKDNVKSITSKLKNLGVYGLQGSKLVDGLELGETESAKILEAISQHQSLAISLATHQYLGVNAISQKGSNKIIYKYLKKLCSGDSLAAFCLLENNNDLLCVNTTAELTNDKTHWVLNGKKTMVVNGKEGDIYIVVAQTDRDKISVFLVEKSFDGIITSPNNNCFKEVDICDVSFNNTLVPVENILGEIGDGANVLNSLSTGFRLSSGPSCITLLQKLIDNVSNFVIKTKYGDQYLCDVDVVRDKIAKISVNLYAIESITYMTCGLLDKYENQDCELESTIVKVFSTEKCLESVQTCLKLIGNSAYVDDHWLNTLNNEALGYSLLNETNDSLRIIISLLGLQHSGKRLQEDVKKSRNPFYFPGFVIKKMFEKRRHDADDPKLALMLGDYLHPSLTLSAQWLEYCVYRLQYATETMLIQHGPEVINQHMELLRLADIAMDIYAMIAVLSRASRSYCIGLQNADTELLLANSFCLDARERIREKVIEISNGKYGTNDGNYQHIAKRLFKFTKYPAEHPLTKNF